MWRVLCAARGPWLLRRPESISKWRRFLFLVMRPRYFSKNAVFQTKISRDPFFGIQAPATTKASEYLRFSSLSRHFCTRNDGSLPQKHSKHDFATSSNSEIDTARVFNSADGSLPKKHSKNGFFSSTNGSLPNKHSRDDFAKYWTLENGSAHCNFSRTNARTRPGSCWIRLRSRRIETDARQRTTLEPEDTDMYIPIKCFFVSRSVDLKRLAKEEFQDIKSTRKELVVRWKDRPPRSPAKLNKPGIPELKSWTCERYMVVYNYGSVVLFNFSDEEEAECLNLVKRYCNDQFEKPQKDDYGVLIRPTLSTWSHGMHDIIFLRKLDTDNIRIIASALGQSIALDYFAKMVDEMINVFSELNRAMERTGTFTMTRKELFQLVASANSTLADVIVRMGLLERSDAAWKNINYARIFEFMREEFELDERFESLYFKLNIIQHNVRLFLEVLQNRKSDILEWIIIVLLAGEIGVGVYGILHDTGFL